MVIDYLHSLLYALCGDWHLHVHLVYMSQDFVGSWEIVVQG